jgi:hypothetical protein
VRLTTISVVAFAILASGALAQEKLSPPMPGQPTTDGSAAIPQAPIGHRQPRMSDLPPDVAEQQRPAEQPGSGGQSRATRHIGLDSRYRDGIGFAHSCHLALSAKRSANSGRTPTLAARESERPQHERACWQ